MRGTSAFRVSHQRRRRQHTSAVCWSGAPLGLPSSPSTRSCSLFHLLPLLLLLLAVRLICFSIDIKAAYTTRSTTPLSLASSPFASHTMGLGGVYKHPLPKTMKWSLLSALGHRQDNLFFFFSFDIFANSIGKETD